MAETVTRLVVTADGALRALDRFEKGMEGSGRATEYTTGAVADFERRIDVARQAIERGNAVTTQSVQRKSAEQRAWERWSATVDKTTALRIKLEREAANASVAATNAVVAGYATQEQAMATLVALERRHADQLARHIALQSAESAEIRDNTTALRVNTAAANDNAAVRRMGAMSSNVSAANVAYQFQDIGVTAAMGMNPLMIGLQQGTQLSMALGGQGLTGTVRALGVAFGSLVNPVSLASIAFTTLGAVGIQALMGLMDGAEDATSALERHRDFLEEVLEGYDAANAAATEALEAAQRLPTGVVRSDLTASLREQAEAAQRLQERIEANRDALGDTIGFLRQIQDIGVSTGGSPEMIEAGIRQIELLRQLGVTTDSTRRELDAAATAARELFNTAEDPAIRDMADDAYQLVQALLAVESQADSTTAALDNIPSEIHVTVTSSFAALEGANDDWLQSTLDDRVEAYEDAAQNIARLTPDLRSAAEQVEAELAAGIEAALTDEQIAQLRASADAALAAIGEQESLREARRSGGRGGGSRDRLDAYEQATTAVNDNIAALERQAATFGMTEEAALRYNTAMDLLQAAQEAGLPITADLVGEVNTLADAYANAAERVRSMQESIEFYRSTFVGFIAELGHGLQQGKSFWESFRDAALNALNRILDRWIEMMANNVFNMIFGAIGGAFGAGFNAPSGYVPGGYYPAFPGNANGTDHWRGGWSWVGERGPELVNLPRGAQVMSHGRSVAYANQNRPAAANANGLVTVRFVDDGGREVGRTAARAGTEVGLDIMIDKIVGRKVGTEGSEINRALAGRFGLTGRLAKR